MQAMQRERASYQAIPLSMRAARTGSTPTHCIIWSMVSACCRTRCIIGLL